jgi:hypothetical protein
VSDGAFELRILVVPFQAVRESGIGLGTDLLPAARERTHKRTYMHIYTYMYIFAYKIHFYRSDINDAPDTKDQACALLAVLGQNRDHCLNADTRTSAVNVCISELLQTFTNTLD